MLHRSGGWWQQHGEECPADHGEIEETGAAAEDATAPNMVGIHPRNRDGAGVSPQEVHGLLDDILDHGFVKSKVQAVGIEIEDDEQRRWNNSFIASAGGALGKPDVEQIKVLSVCGSHTNMVLRVFFDAVEHQGNKGISLEWGCQNEGGFQNYAYLLLVSWAKHTLFCVSVFRVKD